MNRINCISLYMTLTKLYQSRVESVVRHASAVEIEYFFKFIALKAIYGNNSGTDLSPSFTTDTIWHQVLLDTKLYRQIEATCRRQIPHYPQRANDSDQAKLRRRLLTLFLIRRIFDRATAPPVLSYKAYGLDYRTPTGFELFQQFCKNPQNRFAVELGKCTLTGTTNGC